MLAEGEELVAGRRPVEEAFVAKRPAKRLLVVPARRHALERLVLHATSLRIPVVEVEGGTLTAVAGFDGHQGIALVVEPRTFASTDEILARAVERGEPPFVLVMDSLEDPQNVGTLLRSAEAAGVHGVLFPTHRQAPLSPAAVKASAGAVEHLLLAPVDDLPGALSDLRIRGLRIAAAEADAPLSADQADLRGPLAIIVGSEGQGLSPAVRRRADLAIRIPMRGAIGSLNAAVAGSILLFAAVAQRGLDEPDPASRQARGLPEPELAATEPPAEWPEPELAATEPPAERPEPELAAAESRDEPAEPADEPAVAPATPPAAPSRRKKAAPPGPEETAAPEGIAVPPGAEPDAPAPATEHPDALKRRKKTPPPTEHLNAPKRRKKVPPAPAEAGESAPAAVAPKRRKKISAAPPEAAESPSAAVAPKRRKKADPVAAKEPAAAADASPAAPDDLLPGTSTASPVRPRKRRTAPGSEPNRA